MQPQSGAQLGLLHSTAWHFSLTLIHSCVQNAAWQKSTQAASQMEPYSLHNASLLYGPWSKVVHYIGNMGAIRATDTQSQGSVSLIKDMRPGEYQYIKMDNTTRLLC